MYKIWPLFLFETLGVRLWVWPLEQTPIWWLKPIPSLNALTQPIWYCGLHSGCWSMLLHILHPVMPCALHLWKGKGVARETAPCSCFSSRTISYDSSKINGKLALRLCLVNCDSKRWEFYKFHMRSVCLACSSHSKAETQVMNISIDLLGVRCWPHPVVTLGVWCSGQGSIFTFCKFGGSEFKSRRSHTFITCTFFFLLVFWSFFPSCLFPLSSLLIL